MRRWRSLRKIDFWVAVCFTLNYIVGSGFLTLPFAFYEAGYILGLVSLLILVVLAIVSVIFILETGERAKALNRRKSLGGTATSVYDYHAISSDSESINSANKEEASYQNAELSSKELGSQLLMPNHVFELPELCENFLGSNGKNVYLVFVTVYLYGVLWAYCSVFASAFATHLPYFKDSADFDLYLILFGFIVVPMSLLELSEQVIVQVALTVFRVVMLVIMLYTVISAFVSGEPEFGSFSHQYSKSPSERFNKIPQLVSIAAYAFLVHHSAPALSQQVKDKRSLTTMFSIALIFCYIAYSLIGAVLSLYFGSSITASSNLCWEHYVGIVGKDGHRPLYAQMVTHFVVLFPALDVASAFPLNAFTLGNNLMSGFHTASEGDSDEISRWDVSKYRLIAAIPPFFLASLKLDLNLITNYTGLTAFGIMLIFPALLSYYSARKLETLGIPTYTIHSNWCSVLWCQVVVGLSGVVLLIVSTCAVIAEQYQKH